MKYAIILIFLCISAIAGAQNTQSTEQIKAQMAKIRQTTNWDDPAAAEKANAEIRRLASQMTGGKSPFATGNNSQAQSNTSKTAVAEIKTTAVSRENVIAIADRYYKRSYKVLDAVSRSQFDQDYKRAASEEFDFKSIRRLTSTGGILITLTDKPDLACVYLAAAVKAMPADTLSVNNFGGYLRLIDSVAASLPVLLYANKLFSGNAVILTQLGNSYFELDEYAKAESYYKKALAVDPDFGQAHSSLCDLYIIQDRLQDAILELFAGVKNMGCSYSKASNNFAYMQQQSENAAEAGNKSAKEEFWNETKRQVNPADALAPLVPDDSRVKIPKFPNCQRVEDWLEGGGWMNATQAYQSFHAYMISFNERFSSAHSQSPVLSPGAALRDYADERMALDCITEMFFNEARDDEEKYRERVEKITQAVNDAKELYINNLETYTDQYVACVEGCSGSPYCLEECHRKFCSNECPNANKFNEFLRRSYGDWLTEFNSFVIRQRRILDDLYGFSMPWLAKIESPYWSLIYGYEVKRVALSISGNCYAAYPQTFQSLSHNSCVSDCSVYANPYPEKPDEVNKKDPNANRCAPNSKDEIALGPCSIGWDCESWEFGCAAGAAFSFKRNSVHKTTTMFLGAGLEGGMGGAKVGGKFGGQITVGDDYSVDGGLKGSVSGGTQVPVTKGGPTGVELEYSVTVLGGVKAEATKVYNPVFR